MEIKKKVNVNSKVVDSLVTTFQNMKIFTSILNDKNIPSGSNKTTITLKFG
jgi:hypothetical protein